MKHIFEYRFVNSEENNETDAQVKQRHRTPNNFSIDFSSLKMNRDNGLPLAMVEDLTEEDAAAINAAFADDEDTKVSLSEEEIAMLFMAKCEVRTKSNLFFHSI